MQALTNSIKKIIKRREAFIIGVVVLLYIAMAFINPIFVSFDNQHALILGIAVEIMVGLGMTLLMICGVLDLSVGANIALSAGVSCYMMIKGVPIAICILTCIAIGTLVGMFNGYFVSYLKLPPFVITLASSNICRGILTALTQAQALSGFSKEFTIIGQGYLFKIQYPIWFAIVVFIVGQFLLSKVGFFRRTYYIGGNEYAARNSGIKVDKMKFLIYTITGFLCGFSAVVLAARHGTTNVSTATNLELRIITGVVVGGASMSGGSGSMVGTVFGLLLMTAISNVMVLMGANVYWQTFITGLTLFLAVVIDQLTIFNKKRQDLKTAEELLAKQKAELSK